VRRFRRGLECKAHRLVYHTTLGLRAIKKEKKNGPRPWARMGSIDWMYGTLTSPRWYIMKKS